MLFPRAGPAGAHHLCAVTLVQNWTRLSVSKVQHPLRTPLGVRLLQTEVMRKASSKGFQMLKAHVIGTSFSEGHPYGKPTLKGPSPEGGSDTQMG